MTFSIRIRRPNKSSMSIPLPITTSDSTPSSQNFAIVCKCLIRQIFYQDRIQIFRKLQILLVFINCTFVHGNAKNVFVVGINKVKFCRFVNDRTDNDPFNILFCGFIVATHFIALPPDLGFFFLPLWYAHFGFYIQAVKPRTVIVILQNGGFPVRHIIVRIRFY
nr:MAG TPA: hypothetical protein [Caudoviricetes sp.]